MGILHLIFSMKLNKKLNNKINKFSENKFVFKIKNNYVNNTKNIFYKHKFIILLIFIVIIKIIKH